MAANEGDFRILLNDTTQFVAMVSTSVGFEGDVVGRLASGRRKEPGSTRSDEGTMAGGWAMSPILIVAQNSTTWMEETQGSMESERGKKWDVFILLALRRVSSFEAILGKVYRHDEF